MGRSTEIRLHQAASIEGDLKRTRPARPVPVSDFVATLRTMQMIVGAERFVVLRLAGHGLASMRKLVPALQNWGTQADSGLRQLLDGYGEAMLAHMEVSIVPLVWEGVGDGQFAEAATDAFTHRLQPQLLPWSGIAFPVQLGAAGNSYVVFTGGYIELASDTVIDMHLKCCQLLGDMLANDERRLAPAASLTEREIACLQMAGDGCISEAIAEKMGLSVHTVNAYLGMATTKLDAVNRIQAIAKAIRLGYIT